MNKMENMKMEIKEKQDWTPEEWAIYHEYKDRKGVPWWAWCITWGFMIAALIADCFR